MYQAPHRGFGGLIPTLIVLLILGVSGASAQTTASDIAGRILSLETSWYAFPASQP